MTKILLSFYVVLIRHFKKRKYCHAVLKSETNVKYVFWKHYCSRVSSPSLHDHFSNAVNRRV